MDQTAPRNAAGFAKKQNDLETGSMKLMYLINDMVQNYIWRNINIQVKDRVMREPLSILSDINGIARSREMITIIGSSRLGKTTLLNAIAHCIAAAYITITGNLLANGQAASLQTI